MPKPLAHEAHVAGVIGQLAGQNAKRVADGAKNFQCAKCPKMYKSAEQAKHHCQRVHGSDSAPAKCPHCPYEGWPLKLALHIKLNHETGKNNLVCPTCGKGCLNAKTLDAHIRETHNRRKTFRCEQCGKIYR